MAAFQQNLNDKPKRKRVKWHERHVTIYTPCPMNELEGLIRMVGDQGYWDTATVEIEGNSIMISYGEE